MTLAITNPIEMDMLALFRSRWLMAFVLPFLFVGLLIGYDFYCHQLDDIYEIHPGQFMNYTESDAQRSAWDSGILFGLISGVPAGVLGLATLSIWKLSTCITCQIQRTERQTR